MKSLLEQYIEHNHFGNLLGIEISYGEPGVIHHKLIVEKKHLATPNAIHGGCTAAILDATMGVGALTLVHEHKKVVATLEMKVSFFKGIAEGEKIFASSKPIKIGKKLLFMEADIVNEKGELLARSSGTFTILSAERSGYTV